MTTAGDLVTDSLKKAGIVGIGQTPLAEDINDGFKDLNRMMAQWQRKRWLVYCLVDTAKVSTGAQSYTVGLGQDFNIVRPDKLEAAYLRQIVTTGQPVDTPLEIIEAREDYSAIPLKTLMAFPGRIFYDSGYPIGRVYPYPIPNPNIYEVHILTKQQLGQFANLAQVVNLPLEYEAAIEWNLSARLRVSYRMPVDAGIVAMAKDALNVIRMANTQIPRLRMPGALRNRGVYNNYSDTVS